MRRRTTGAGAACSWAPVGVVGYAVPKTRAPEAFGSAWAGAFRALYPSSTVRISRLLLWRAVRGT
ncbi:MAG: hypothetical protein E2P02_03590 [Acidobacteria bacterium]|nr:MAG: hypothetical protein E2P02_03590 [Acidobacteriota bacterium]